MKVSQCVVVGAVGLLYQVNLLCALSGHVCNRQKAQTYMQQYDRAFVCPERYTTACGQLDWRRCTKYRVSTCHTPSERYATRYQTVEECCPGWRENGDGACVHPVCPGGCLNGGLCADLGGIPGCSCQDGYHGNRCEQEKNNTDYWSIILASLIGILVIIVTAVSVLIYRRIYPRFSAIPSVQQESSASQTSASANSSSPAGDPSSWQVPSAPTLCE